MIIKMFVKLGKVKPNKGIIRGLNVTTVRLNPFNCLSCRV